MRNSILFFLALCGGIVSCTQAQKPNIILIMTDDQGWFDAGFNGNQELLTPNLDQLASEGIILDRFYSASAVCSPTRASVLTGRNPLRMNIPHANSGSMKAEEITLPEILSAEGYATGHFGKWHLGTLTLQTRDANRGGREEHQEHYSIPSMHGYDSYFCTESKVPTFNPMVCPLEYEEGESKRYGWKAREHGEETEIYGTSYWSGIETRVDHNLEGDDSRVIMDRAISFIESAAKKNKPFFTTLWIHTPHLPVVSDLEHRNLYDSMDLKKQIYFGSLTAMDEQVGRLWSTLESLGIERETMIWFCSDNGPENNTPGSAGEFRERKRSLYEGGVRVPAFVVWKEKLQGGERLHFPSLTNDYLPTILEVLDIEYPDERPLDGESIWDLLKGEKESREKAIGFLINEKMSWVNTQYKLISVDGGHTFELYDLVNDRGEQEDLSARKPETVAKMKEELLTWISSVEKSKKGLDYP